MQWASLRGVKFSITGRIKVGAKWLFDKETSHSLIGNLEWINSEISNSEVLGFIIYIQ